jgi:membrane-associated protease RseP (regulator of RpoE activity)
VFRLSPQTNEQLINIQNGGAVGPLTKDALGRVLAGGLLNDSQAGYLRGALNNPNLQPHEKAAISSALQEDRTRKERLNSNVIPVFPAPVVPVQPGPIYPVVPQPVVVNPPVYIDPPVVVNGSGVVVEPPVVVNNGGVIDPPLVNNGGVVNSPVVTQPAGAVKITSLVETGAAAVAGLRQGDVILSFNGVATPSFDALREAVAAAAGPAEVIFFNPEPGQKESLTVTPAAGKIGVDVEPVQLASGSST